MTERRPCALLGKWRLVEADQWDRGYLNMVEPAYIRFDGNGDGEMVFGALRAGLRCRTGSSIVFFSFEGSDEMDPVRGTGSAELAEDGSLEVEIAYDNDDEALIKGRRW